LLTDHFKCAADDDHALNAKLSGRGKEGRCRSPRSSGLFHDGAQFLRALLLAVDESYLRDP
jgi:hypothetical protein